MKTAFFLFALMLAVSPSAFSQNHSTEKAPKAYLLSSGDNSSANRPKEAYLLSSGDTRQRVYKSESLNLAQASKTLNALQLELRAFDLINQQRSLIGLGPLVWCDDAAKIARLHSENMATYNFFSHKGLDGLLVNDRADLFGVKKWQAIGENIAYNQGFENPVEFAVEHWMNSPKHRDNLLSSRWKESGIGVSVTDEGRYYFTEVFLLRK
jgi:uncharacterized protein YkwD